MDEGPHGIRVNAVALGSIATERYDAYLRGLDEPGRLGVEAEMAALHPLGRVGSAGEVADVVAWLLGPGSGYVSGAVLPVDGAGPRRGGTRRRGEPMARRLLLAVAAYVVLALVVVGWGWLLTHPLRGSIEGTDDRVSRWFEGQRTSWLDPVSDVGTLLGETPVGLAVGAVIAVVAGIALRSVAAAALVLLADVGDGGIYWLGSHADPRDRPPVRILDPGLVPDHSFPSGHVGTAVAVYGGAALLLALWLRSRRPTGGGRTSRGGADRLPAALRRAEPRLPGGAPPDRCRHQPRLRHHLAGRAGHAAPPAQHEPRSTRDTIGGWTPRHASTAPVTARSSST